MLPIVENNTGLSSSSSYYTNNTNNNKQHQRPPLHKVVVDTDDEKYYNDEFLNLTNGLIECFEVVVDDVKKGKVRVYHRIVSLRISQQYQNSIKDQKQQREHEEEEEKREDESSPEEDDEDLSDSILESLLFSCVGCEPLLDGLVPRKQVKSILKKTPPITSPTNKYLTTNTNNEIPAIQHSMSNRNVSFSSIEIKEFKMTLGDHPSATSGPPVRLDWNSKPTIERTISLDEYESKRLPRRSRKQLKLSYKDRNDYILLKEQGFTQNEINLAWAEALKIRQQRYETIQRGVSTYQITIDDLLESLQRKCKRVTDTVSNVVPNNVVNLTS